LEFSRSTAKFGVSNSLDEFPDEVGENTGRKEIYESVIRRKGAFENIQNDQYTESPVQVR
jgi:hypothetical protein